MGTKYCWPPSFKIPGNSHGWVFHPGRALQSWVFVSYPGQPPSVPCASAGPAVVLLWAHGESRGGRGSLQHPLGLCRGQAVSPAGTHWSHPFSPHEPAGRGQLKRCADIKGNKVEKNMERKETCILQLGREDWGAHLSTASENASFPGTFLFRRCRLPHPTSSHILHSSFPPLPILTGPIPKRQILPSGYF